MDNYFESSMKFVLFTEALESDSNDEDYVTADVNTTYEYPEHVVTVTTVCDIDLGSKSTCIGSNKVHFLINCIFLLD